MLVGSNARHVPTNIVLAGVESPSDFYVASLEQSAGALPTILNHKETVRVEWTPDELNYALYHAPTRATAKHLLPSGTDEDKLKITRLFRHNGVKASEQRSPAARGAKSSPYLDPISQSLQSTPLLDVAMVFCDLQEARHKADYDHLETFSKPATVGLVADAKKALKTLETVQAKDREAFLALLAMSLRNQRVAIAAARPAQPNLARRCDAD